MQLNKLVLLTIILCRVGIACGSDTSPERKRSSKQERSFATKGPYQILYDQHKKKFFLASGVGLGTYLLYRWHPGLNSYVQEKVSAAKQKFIHLLAAPAYAQYDRIKDQGLSRKDVALLGLFLASCYGAKRLVDRYKIGSGLWEGNLVRTKEVVSEDIDFIKRHKIIFGGGIALLGFCTWILKNEGRRSRIERFLWSLTHRQKRTISQCPELSALVEKAPEDPTVLHGHKQFRSLLEEHQKELLSDAVEEYRFHNDPLSLFDDEPINV